MQCRCISSLSHSKADIRTCISIITAVSILEPPNASYPPPLCRCHCCLYNLATGLYPRCFVNQALTAGITVPIVAAATTVVLDYNHHSNRYQCQCYYSMCCQSPLESRGAPSCHYYRTPTMLPDPWQGLVHPATIMIWVPIMLPPLWQVLVHPAAIIIWVPTMLPPPRQVLVHPAAIIIWVPMMLPPPRQLLVHPDCHRK